MQNFMLNSKMLSKLEITHFERTFNALLLKKPVKLNQKSNYRKNSKFVYMQNFMLNSKMLAVTKITHLKRSV